MPAAENRPIRSVRSLCLAALWLGAMAALPALGAADPAGSLAERPFTARLGRHGPTMFTLLPPEQTGVVTTNSYADPRMWGTLYQQLVYGETGTGMAVGDYDNDGLPDLLVLSKSGGCRLFHNLGHWRFEDVTEKAGLGRVSEGAWDRGLSWIKDSVGGGDGTRDETQPWEQGATFVDVNNDGLLDIYICRFGEPNLLYINQGDGTFKEEAAKRGLAVADASGMAAFCDYDRDGWLDVYIHTSMYDPEAHPEGQRGYLFHNNGDGTFTNVTEKAGISGRSLSHAAIWWDYDGDGWPDLYVTNDYATPDRLYHNNRDGTFTDAISQVVPHMPYFSMGADLGDITNDGQLDLFVADMAATTHEKDQRGMAGSRARTLADPADPAEAPQSMHNALYLNTGTGRCLEVANLAGLAATDWTWSVRLEDLDNDGRLDLFVTNGMIREYHNEDLLGRTLGSESPQASRLVVRSSPKFAERHLAFRNLGDLRFEEVSASWGLNQKGVAFGAALGDFGGDGNLDLVFANYGQGVTFLRNDCDTGHSVTVALRGTRSNSFGVGATVRIESTLGQQVRQLVLERGYLSSSEPVLHFGLGKDTRIDRLTVSWPSGLTQAFTDLGVDRRFTITEPASSAGAPQAARPGTPGQFSDVAGASGLSVVSHEGPRPEPEAQPLMPTRFSRRGPALAVGDLEGRGDDDLLLGGTSADSARLLARGGSGSFNAIGPAILASGSTMEDGPCLVFDAAGTGAADVLETKAGASAPDGSPQYQPRLFLNDGHGTLRPAPDGSLPSLPISVGAVAAADFEHNGRLGLFIGGRISPGNYPLSPPSALLANRGARFEDVTDSLAPGLRRVGMVTSAIWSDVDGDGWPDLVLATEWGKVRYFHNNAGRGFEDWTEKAGFASAGSGWWTSLAAADFNGDGRPDFVAGNAGLNTAYHASPEQPALLYYGTFAEGGANQLIEAYYEGDRLYPWRSRRELGAQIPSILQRYPRNNVYARATLGEILGEDHLAAARRFAATQLQSGVFLSQPDGTYRFEALPRIAQAAPFQGLVAGDFSGEASADIYAVQNSYAPPAVVGRFDGGLSQLLRGDGRGHFAPVSVASSGLIVPGDAKALVVTDLDHDGWPDFVLSRNNASTMAFRNGGRPGYHSLCVRLRGQPGNPTGVGARVTLKLADGSAQSAEVYAGSGYYSQSSPACFFGWPRANPPSSLTVRWPDNRVTYHGVQPSAATVVLSESDPR